jgi:hypothetical protein
MLRRRVVVGIALADNKRRASEKLANEVAVQIKAISVSSQRATKRA